MSGEGFEVKDQDCGYVSMAIFDLGLMVPVTDATVLELNSSQMASERVEFETTLHLIDGFKIDVSDPERMYCLVVLKRQRDFYLNKRAEANLAVKLVFSDFSVEDSNKSIVQINRIGYIAREKRGVEKWSE